MVYFLQQFRRIPLDELLDYVLGLFLAAGVGIFYGIGYAVLGKNSGALDAALAGKVDGIGQYAHTFLRRMKAHAVVGGHVIPTQLGLAHEFSHVGQLIVICPGLCGRGDVQMGL